jgi:hypothetical protein
MAGRIADRRKSGDPQMGYRPPKLDIAPIDLESKLWTGT